MSVAAMDGWGGGGYGMDGIVGSTSAGTGGHGGPRCLWSHLDHQAAGPADQAGRVSVCPLEGAAASRSPRISGSHADSSPRYFGRNTRMLPSSLFQRIRPSIYFFTRVPAL